MGDYFAFYLKCDIFCWLMCFKKFRNSGLRNCYGLCPSHQFSAPDMSWDAMLNMTSVELKHISVVNTYLLFVKGMRGAASYIFKRQIKSNKIQLNSHNLKQEPKNSIPLNANNVYGYAMSNFCQQVDSDG